MVGTYMFCKHHGHIAIKVESVAAASRCVVIGRGLSQAIVKEVAEFSICAFDKNGVKRLTGGDEFKVSVKHVSIWIILLSQEMYLFTTKQKISELNQLLR